ncbi:uncharacterized protein [Amphiura filiformis]|uniref:uncharacterized protein n=1 Tax=Amphiura filiformis TaxID=82378 RepID=UPI003B2184F7
MDVGGASDRVRLIDEIAEENANIQKKSHGGKVGGLTIFTAAIFIVGDMAGSGVLALPRAVVDSGWIGLVLIVVCAFISAYTGVVLGRCWVIIKDRFPEKYATDHVRYPYPAIGYEAAGIYTRYIITFCVNFTLFGVSTVFLLLAADNMQSLLNEANVNMSFCYWLPILAAILCPFTWFGTPKDFWPIAAGAFIATAIACVLLFIQIFIDYDPSTKVEHKSTDFTNFFLAFGTILFAFGGHAVFPTIQHDMKRPENFPRTVFLSYSVILTEYLPIAAAGYFIFGNQFFTQDTDNILSLLSDNGLTVAVTVLITCHLVCGFIIVINPFCQELEELFKIPLEFNWKRVVLRTIVCAFVLFVAETIPSFGAILSLIGGSTVTFLTFVFPSFFYIRLNRMRSPKEAWGGRKMQLYEYILHGEIIMVGVLGAIASTYSAIDSIATGASRFTVPCYVNVTAAHQ